MKKKLALVLAVCLLILSLAACSSKDSDGSSDILGKWSITGFTLEGKDYDKDMLPQLVTGGINSDGKIDYSFDLTIKKDGSAEMYYFGNEFNASWEDKGGGSYDLIVEGDHTEMILDGGMLKVTIRDSLSLILEK